MYLYHFYNSNNQSTIFSFVSMELFFLCEYYKVLRESGDKHASDGPATLHFQQKVLQQQ